jgi:hypothetical protein
MIGITKQFIIHTSYTAPPKPECIERETMYMECMWAVWERRCRNFFFTSHLLAAAVKHRPYREEGGKGGQASGAVGLEERSLQMVRKDVCRWE